MSSSLSAATQDRKARLAQLKSLKRKQPTDSELEEPFSTTQDASDPSYDNTTAHVTKSPRLSPTTAPDAKPSYLSGRNYDAATRGPKLGFESAPIASSTVTLENRAAELAAAIKAQAAKEVAEAEAPLDLFKLQPKKPNWDLKRDLERKMEVLGPRTDNAIARLVRERIEGAQAKAREKGSGSAQRHTGNGNAQIGGSGEEEGQSVGIEGASLVEATREREREDEEDARRDREIEGELLDET